MPSSSRRVLSVLALLVGLLAMHGLTTHGLTTHGLATHAPGAMTGTAGAAAAGRVDHADHGTGVTVSTAHGTATAVAHRTAVVPATHGIAADEGSGSTGGHPATALCLAVLTGAGVLAVALSLLRSRRTSVGPRPVLATGPSLRRTGRRLRPPDLVAGLCVSRT